MAKLATTKTGVDAWESRREQDGSIQGLANDPSSENAQRAAWRTHVWPLGSLSRPLLGCAGMWCFRMRGFKKTFSKPLTNTSFRCEVSTPSVFEGQSTIILNPPHLQTPHPRTPDFPPISASQKCAHRRSRAPNPRLASLFPGSRFLQGMGVVSSKWFDRALLSITCMFKPSC